MAYVGRSPKYGFLEGQTATFNGSTTVVTLQRSVSSTDALDVYIDNVHQEPDVAYNLSSGGSAITFTGTPANGQKLYIRFHGISFDTARASKLTNTNADSTLTISDSHTLTLNLNGTTALTATTSGITIPNLTVTGTTTSVNSTQLVVGDNQIILNSDVASGVAPSEDAGIVINRGSSADVAFLWDEGEDYWLAADPIVSSTRLSTIKGGTTPTIAATTVGLFQSSATSQSAAISIIANSGQSSILNFGDENDENAGSLTYNHSSGTFALAGGNANFSGSVTATGVTVGNSNLGSNSSHLANITLNNNGYIGSANASTALQIQTSGNAVFSGSVTTAGLTSSSPINLTAGALAAAGNAGLSHRSSDNKVYLQAGTGGFNILDDQQNTHFFIDSAGAATFSGELGIGGAAVPSATNYNGAALHVRQAGSSSVGSQLRLTTGATGHTASDGSFIAAWADSGLYITNQENAKIAFSTGGSERMQLDGNGLLKFTGGSAVDSSNTNFNINLPATGGLTIGSAYTFANIHGDSGGSVYIKANAYPANTGSVSFIKLQTANSSGGGDSEVTVSGGNISFASGKGISFAATGAGTDTGGTNETLSDFETGTWSPKLTDINGNEASYQSGFPTGTYIKVGRHVWVNFSIRITAKNAMTGNYVFVANLPFTKDSTAEGRGTGTIDYYSGFAQTKSYLALDMSSTTTVMWLVGGTNATGSHYVPVSHLNNACMFKGGANYIAT